MCCNLSYIPERLHSKGRLNVDEFYVGEHMYRRCAPEDKTNPFDKISLIDLSVNRKGFPDDIFSYPEDALYNTNPSNGKGEKYEGEVISCLEIKELTDDKRFFKQHTENKLNAEKVEVPHTVAIMLKHKKNPCNYSHCAFEIHYDGIEMTFDNYKKTLGKDSKLKTWCKHELSKMVVREELWINE